tara:strand:+ start:29779 stop:30123 length:345 start_codon:yes stop_codon:yes gene_type:complete
MSITLSENAAKQILKKITNRGKGIALRVGIKKVGCSGFAYTFDYADEINSDDILFKSHDAKLVVSSSNLKFLDGSNIDFVREGLNDSFKFNNPNVENTCGCGESFSIKDKTKEN